MRNLRVLRLPYVSINLPLQLWRSVDSELATIAAVKAPADCLVVATALSVSMPLMRLQRLENVPVMLEGC